MSDAVIQCDHLSKKYIIQHDRRERYATLRDTLADSFRRFGQRVLRSSSSGEGGGADSPREELWALQDLSFEMKQGERLGIIGRNGAGKSTLLKILSRITEPTRGRVRIRGRVASLLEVGTGFHPELTGKENIFLNGAVLGMSKREIERKFDEIVAFSEVEKFLDTPLKRYSSGMQVRLAFAIAAHLDPEILIVDEVLAVGDFAFQKKCLDKMQDVAESGRTVLFVSHDMGAINTLCERALLLHAGSLIAEGNASQVVERYLDTSSKLYSPLRSPVVDRGEFRLTAVTAIQNERPTNVINCRAPFKIAIEYEIVRVVPGSRLVLILRNQKGEILFTTCDYDDRAEETINRRVGRFVSAVTVPGKLLKEGTIYGTVDVDVRNERVLFAAVDTFHVDVVDPDSDPLTELHRRDGIIAPVLQWATIPAEGASGRPTEPTQLASMEVGAEEETE